ncbi:MAG: helix-turn-helix domain-containing protein [Bacillaceae bacterium]|nr:helix-turn-helix domain-containing protein [Bacillaceae bacterium]
MDKKKDAKVENELNKVVGKTIRLRRKRLGKSIETVALDANIHPSYLSEIERGKSTPSYYILLKVAYVIGLNNHALFAGTRKEIEELLKEKEFNEKS